MNSANKLLIAITSVVFFGIATLAQAEVAFRVISVQAIETTFGVGDDEVFLTTNNGMRFPTEFRSIEEGETWTLNAEVRSSDTVIMELREHDTIGGSDIIGSFAVDGKAAPGRYTADLRGDGAVYAVIYEVLPQVNQSAGTQQEASSESVQQVPERRWSFSNNGDNVTAFDCGDGCEEDLGVILQCTDINQLIRVEVPWVAAPNGPEGATGSIQIDIDGARFNYTATKGPNGLVGFVPRFEVSAFDPLIEAMQGGDVMTVVFEGVAADIGLSGSRVALENFRAQCPRGTKAQSQVVKPSSDQPAKPVGVVTPNQSQQGVLQPVQPAKPGVLQPVQPTQPGVVKPVQPGTVQPAPSNGLQPVQPRAAQPAQPAPDRNVQRVMFTCNNGTNVLLSDLSAGAGYRIGVSINNGPQIPLDFVSQQQNGGSLFSDGRLQVVSVGRTLQVSNGQTQINCQPK